MLRFNRAYLLGVLLIGLLVCSVIAGNVSVVRAQDPVASPGTPEATATPVPTSTPAPTSTPTILSEAGEQVADSVSSIDTQTILNLIISFIVVALLAVFGGRLIYSLLRRFTKRTATDLDNVFLEAIRLLVSWLIAAIGFQIATSRLDFLSDTATDILEDVYFLLYLFVAVAAVWRVGDEDVQRIAKAIEELK